MRQLSRGTIFAGAMLTALLGGCTSVRAPEAPSILGEPARPSARQPVLDNDLIGVWSIARAELSGKVLVTPPEFELRISGNQYSAGVPSGPADKGRIALFGDELAGQARRLDVIGEVGQNKGKRIPALYRMVGRDLEIIYDMSGNNRPTEFVSREGSQLFRATYRKKQ